MDTNVSHIKACFSCATKTTVALDHTYKDSAHAKLSHNAVTLRV